MSLFGFVGLAESGLVEVTEDASGFIAGIGEDTIVFDFVPDFIGRFRELLDDV